VREAVRFCATELCKTRQAMCVYSNTKVLSCSLVAAKKKQVFQSYVCVCSL
jgi:hypothetical protein